ncbi:hypothetical protein [Candidatus Manganitrophus noduliformans]|uniref:Type-F conjugative transfer system protein TraW n=1 Tax=Candidatus Manganitrophus noduliformans TaxID=2606439 RepID=A0A7X6I9Z0_9BACT|nr:hypothetical protein [Candidatus Manganitrophus noduliformans]NKE70166.1 hypothetical protein [Candidatus Manganitrophus noduliformans]
MARSEDMGRNLGVAGATYAIAEPDALSEIEARAKEVNWEERFNEKKMKQAVASYRPSGLRRLPRATTTRTRAVEMTYTLSADIPDGQGGVLYPRGYTFNPLQYVSLPNTLVIIDAEDAEQVAWFRSSEYANDPKAFLLLTGGSYSSLIDILKRPVYYADANLIERLKVRSTPAIAIQKGSMMEVQEIAIPSKK